MYTVGGAGGGTHSGPGARGKVGWLLPCRSAPAFPQDMVSIRLPSALADHSSVSTATAGCSLALAICTCAVDS